MLVTHTAACNETTCVYVYTSVAATIYAELTTTFAKFYNNSVCYCTTTATVTSGAASAAFVSSTITTTITTATNTITIAVFAYYHT